ncbi:BT_3987 domain-containing protein [Gaoshiqia sp. Z1-71]|uniref:BT_3987 domain-containing protein n=1 Tax=Gaoshiqia hydrogeniformans TaxID=3290090 RepID=UPI003BF838B0
MKTDKYILVILLAVLSSCGFEEDVVSFDKTLAYFYNQNYNRNIVVGEGLNLKAGIMFSGLVNNNKERVVKYVIDPAVVTDGTKTVMPASYYTLSNGTEFVIPKGEHQGYVGIKIDSTAFLADPKSLTGEYVIPFRLVESADVDSINSEKDYMVISVSYWAKQHGNYYYSGKTVRTSDAVVETLTYKNTSTISESIKQLTTVGPKTMVVKADATAGSKDPAKGKFTFHVEAPSVGSGEVLVSGAPGSAIQVLPNGTSSYDAASRTFYLKYKYTDGAFECEATDTLVFRNRVRDIQADGQGVNEWR